jgi:hypothetical protein
MGAAILSMVGAGEYSSVSEAADKIVKTASTVSPESALVEKYEKKYNIFKALYPAFKHPYLVYRKGKKHCGYPRNNVCRVWVHPPIKKEADRPVDQSRQSPEDNVKNNALVLFYKIPHLSLRYTLIKARKREARIPQGCTED